MNADFHEKFNRVITKLEESGNEYADAKAESYYLQEMKSSFLSSLMSKLEGPVSQREMKAKASDEYQNFLAGLREAIRKEGKAKSEYKKWDASFEGLRSLSSLEKRTLDKTEGF